MSFGILICYYFSDELLAIKKQKLLSQLDVNQSAPSTSNYDSFDSLDNLKNSKCRAPFIDQNGQIAFYNAIIMDVDQNCCKSQDNTVKVLFCNPISESMRPCNYFLNGNCKFEDEKCKNSHGHLVSLANIKPFEQVDYSLIKRVAICLAKNKLDNLWYKAIVDDYIIQDHKIVVKYERINKVDSLDLEDIIPLANETVIINSDEDDNDGSSDSEESDKNEDEEDEKIPILKWNSNNNNNNNNATSVIGQWEVHTKGIGLKLLIKMGYVPGKGLGKNGEGRSEPVGYCILPARKSLDECIKWKEKKFGDPVKYEKKMKAQQEKQQAKIAKGYNHQPRSNVFDLINNKVAAAGSSKESIEKPKELSMKKFKEKSNQNLNVDLFKLTEKLRKAEDELQRLKSSLERHKTRDKLVSSQIQSKIKNQLNLIKSLKEQERDIQKEQTLRSDKKKLSWF